MEAATLFSVHTEHTTCRRPADVSYQQYRRLKCETEWQATSQLFSYLDRRDESHLQTRFNCCRSDAWFTRNIDTGEVRVIANACKLRWCPICGKARQAYATETIGKWLRKARYPKFVTLTLKHTNAPLVNQLDALYRSFTLLRKRSLWRKNVTQGVWFFQVKLDKQGTAWHPHIHSIIAGNYIDHYKLRKLWHKITKTSNIVDIRMIRDPKAVASEVARYTSRPAVLTDKPLSVRLELYDSLHKRKTCGVFGKDIDVRLSPPPADDKDRWERVGSWSFVTHLSESDDAAKAILEAWQEGTPLKEGVSVQWADDFVAGIPDIPPFWELDKPPPETPSYHYSSLFQDG